MKRYLISEKGKFYKANLHMHTTISDGKETPEEVKAAYMAAGYSIVAFSDHEVLLSHEDLTDENFLAITSFEKSVDCPTISEKYHHKKTAHMNFFAKDPKNLNCPVLNPKTVWGNALNHITEEMKKCDYEAEYSTEGLNDIIKKANEAGFLVTLNHPVWSLQNYEDYIGLDGLWGIEIYNTGSVVEGYRDTVQPLTDLLQLGKQVFPVAADDAHCLKHHFGGFVMVKSEKLEYKAIMKALEDGEFYASSGPEIDELYIDDDKLIVKCSPSRAVIMSSVWRRRKCVMATPCQHLDYAVFDIKDYLAEPTSMGRKEYIRITVVGFDGETADTRAYFIDELLK